MTGRRPGGDGFRRLAGSRLILAAAVIGMATLAACGWVEWPVRESRPRSVNRPPVAATTAAPSDAVFVGTEAVTIGRGDTVYALSRRHGVSTRAIIEANQLAPPYLLRVGQRIALPRSRQHVVVAGESLYGISRLYGVDSFELARANGLADPPTVAVGQRLVIPEPGTAPAAVAVAPAVPVVVETLAPEAARPDAPGSEPSTAENRVPDLPPHGAEADRAPPVSSPGSETAAARAPTVIPRPLPRSGKGFLWPVQGQVVSTFGPKGMGLHNDGINIEAPRGAPVRAAENGVVAYAGNELRGFGNLLLIKHDGGWVTAYAHNDALLVAPGQRVKKGDVVARVGSTGNVATPQLHFELRRGTQAIDPRGHLDDGRA